MKKKSKKLIILLCAIILIMAIGTGGYTYAKYITAVKGGGQADIAKWSFTVGKNSEQIQNIALSNIVDKNTLVNGKIAPGTSGEFFIDIDGTGSEVGIDYEVKFSNEKNKPSNIVFSIGEQKYKSLSEIKEMKGNIGINDSSKTRRVQVNWKWEYETGTDIEINENDILDTTEGVANLDYSFDVAVIGTQSR